MLIFQLLYNHILFAYKYAFSLVCLSERRVLPNCRVYFANHKSKITQWEDPRRSMAEQLPLPRGWEIRFTKDNKKYFIDHNTKTTTFIGNDMFIATYYTVVNGGPTIHPYPRFTSIKYLCVQRTLANLKHCKCGIAV